MQISYANVDLARQVLDRQASQHLPALQQHFSTWARLEASDLGLILQVFQPANEALVGVGEKVLQVATDVYRAGASNVEGVKNAYAEADRQAHDRIADVAGSLGIQVPPFQDPREGLPALGQAKDDAGPYYRAGDPNLFEQAFQDGYRLGDWLKNDVVERTKTRAGEIISASPTVAEEQDVQSYLIEPTGSTSEIENLRWNAGIILGSLDWVFEKLFGMSILNELVFKPFAGDWNRVQQASGAWKIAGDAIHAISMNTTGILPGLSEWTGRGSEAFMMGAGAVAAAANSVSGVAGTISSLLKAFAWLVKKISKMIGKILESIANKLARMAAEAAIPVVGWAAMVIEMADAVHTVWSEFREAYTLVNKIYDFVSRLVSARGAIVDTYYQVSQVAEALARGAAARA